MSPQAVPDLRFEMGGPLRVRHQLTAFYRALFPQHLAAYTEAWGLDPEVMVAPASTPGDPRTDAYLPREPDLVDRWPLLAVTTGRAVQGGERDFDADGNPQYRVTYPVRVYTWVKAEGFGATQDLRDDYGTVARITALSHNDLGTAGALQLVPSTVLTDFSAVAGVKGDRFVAGSYVGFNVIALETLTDRLALPGGPPRDTVIGVNAVTSPLPTPPAPVVED